jgi:hypothetical protein
MHRYWSVFLILIATPFEHITLVWGIVPLYFGLLLNEVASAKTNFRTAIQTGFSFLWAVAQWTYPYFAPHAKAVSYGSLEPINILVTLLVLAFGLTALVSGLRQRFPKYGRFLGHTRFANYFMITIFPIQAHYLPWTWARLAAIALFAVPIWLALHFGLMPVRGRK